MKRKTPKARGTSGFLRTKGFRGTTPGRRLRSDRACRTSTGRRRSRRCARPDGAWRCRSGDRGRAIVGPPRPAGKRNRARAAPAAASRLGRGRGCSRARGTASPRFVTPSLAKSLRRWWRTPCTLSPRAAANSLSRCPGNSWRTARSRSLSNGSRPLSARTIASRSVCAVSRQRAVWSSTYLFINAAEVARSRSSGQA